MAKFFHLFDLDGDGVLEQDVWIEHLKGRLKWVTYVVYVNKILVMGVSVVYVDGILRFHFQAFEIIKIGNLRCLAILLVRFFSHKVLNKYGTYEKD